MSRFGQQLPQTVDLVTASAELILTAETEEELMRDYGMLRELELWDFNWLFFFRKAHCCCADVFEY